MGNLCPYPYGPAGGAMNGMDEVRNLEGRRNRTEQRVRQMKNRLSRLDGQIRRAKSDMRKVLSERTIQVVTEHRLYNRHADSYQQSCSRAVRRAGGRSGYPPRGSRQASGRRNHNLPPSPAEFCVEADGQIVNYWVENFALDNGQVDPSICDRRIGDGGWPEASSADSSACRRGLKEYDELVAQKANLENDIGELEAKVRSYERKLDRIQDEISEGTYCMTGNCPRRGYATGSNTQNVLSIAAMLAAVGARMFNNSQRQPMMRPAVMPVVAPGFGPMPPMMRPAPVMPYNGGFPAQPYAARIPGYMGIGPGNVYGAVPGAVGPGAFGCQGTNPLMAGGAMAPGMLPFMNGSNLNPFMGGNNIFSNPYAAPFLNPAMQNGLFNPGYGPGFMPMLGNGVPGYSPYDPFNQFNNPMLNAASPYMLPYLGGNPFANNPSMQHPYFNSGYQFNPWFNNSGLMNAPGMLPYMGGASGPYGAMPYGNGNLGFSYSNPNLAANGSLVGNFYSQLDSLNRNIQLIQTGAGWSMGAPAVLPYPSSRYVAPSYNSPGLLNPGARLYPQPLPAPVRGR